MKHLLDVNILLAGIVETHVHHKRTLLWLEGKEIVLCPISELGFVRISSNPKVIGLTMADARKSLEKFVTNRKAARIPADLDALESHPNTSEQATDHYLADLAKKHGMKLATLDSALKHPSAVLVS